jgi:Holliday junction resolvase RusA-like endonuclease
MRLVINLVLPPAVSVNQAYGTSRHMSGMYTKAKGKKFKQAVRDICEARGVTPFDGWVKVTLAAYFGRRGNDCDNISKLLLDSLQGYCFVNDSQITQLHILKFLDHDNPRVEVSVSADIGYNELCPCTKCTRKMGNQ